MLERALKMRRPFCYNFSTLFGKVQQGFYCRVTSFLLFNKNSSFCRRKKCPARFPVRGMDHLISNVQER